MIMRSFGLVVGLTLGVLLGGCGASTHQPVPEANLAVASGPRIPFPPPGLLRPLPTVLEPRPLTRVPKLPTTTPRRTSLGTSPAAGAEDLRSLRYSQDDYDRMVAKAACFAMGQAAEEDADHTDWEAAIEEALPVHPADGTVEGFIVSMAVNRATNALTLAEENGRLGLLYAQYCVVPGSR